MGFGLGAFPAGTTPAGYDPVIPAGAPRRVVPPPALKFDGTARDFLLDENGFYQASHPVDQQVALALCVSRGAIASVSSIGNKLRTISRVSASVAETLGKTYIREGLAPLTSAKSIEIEGVQVDATTTPGRLLFAVTYLNLELAYITENKSRTLIAELAYA